MMDGTIPFLTGWLTSCAMQKSGEVMKVVNLEVCAVDRFRVTFASGLTLEVQVSEVPKMRGQANDTTP